MKTSSAVLSLLAASATYVAAAPAQPHDLAARAPKHGKHSNSNSTVGGSDSSSQNSNGGNGLDGSNAQNSNGGGGIEGLIQEVRRRSFSV